MIMLFLKIDRVVSRFRVWISQSQQTCAQPNLLGHHHNLQLRQRDNRLAIDSPGATVFSRVDARLDLDRTALAAGTGISMLHTTNVSRS